MKKDSPRLTVVRTLTRILTDNVSLTNALFLKISPAEENKSWISAMCYGILRHRMSLQTQLSQLMNKSFYPKEIELHVLLLLGLYELRYTETPDYAVVNETVSVCVALNKSWAKNVINAVLRRSIRESTDSVAVNTAHEHPAWLLSQIQHDYPTQWQSICDENLKQAPMTLRVNLARISQADYLARLEKSGNRLIRATPGLAPTAIYLAEPIDVQDVPEFNTGWVSVQDEAGQWAALLLDLQSGQRVLDACAAPGSKTGHILETEPHLAALVALDKDPARVALLNQTLSRLQLTATVETGDAEHYSLAAGAPLFDRILLDAPCSATGIIRRHPDILCRRQPEDIALFAAQQLALLNNLWQTLKPGGRLLYSTCSILQAENADVIAAFLTQHPEAKHDPIQLPVGAAATLGWQILPGQARMDGFYYARLMK